MNQPNQLEPEWVSRNFIAFERSLNGSASGPLHAKRTEAFNHFCRLGFPTPRHEDWKYTDVAPITRNAFALTNLREKQAPLDSETVARIPAMTGALTYVFIDGEFRREISSAVPTGGKLSVYSLAEVLKPGFPIPALAEQVSDSLGSVASPHDHPFVALNTAFLRDGAVVHIAQGAEVAEPVHIVFISDPAKQGCMSQPRLLVLAGENSTVTVIESFISAGPSKSLVSHVGEVIMGAGARVDHYKFQNESDQGFHFGSLSAYIARDCEFRTHTFAFGGSLVRNEVCPVLGGKGAVAVLNGLSVLRDNQHVDNFTVIDHAQPHCESHELYKGIYADKSAGVFSGTIIVRPDAQKTNALQTNQSLLLSPTATIESKPQLKIWADDVKCTHGATVGQLDEHALFYLRSRGVPKKEARDMLIHAFASDVISGVRPTVLRAFLEEVLTKKLESIGLL